jgi:hypothetical protein
MAERIKVHYKCCCGAEINIDVDEYKRSWLDERVLAFSDLHKDCPEKYLKKISEIYPRFAVTNPISTQTLFDKVPGAMGGV